MTIFSVGQPCPVRVDNDGLQLNGSVPVMIIIGIESPNPEEVEVIRRGHVSHRFGSNDITAWMTLHFYKNPTDDHSDAIFKGEVFYCGGAISEEFTDERLLELRQSLPEGVGIGCTMILVDTDTQIIRTMRMYAWSNVLSHAFLDAAEATRSVDRDTAYNAATNLMDNTTDQLAALATVTFDLSGV